MRALFLVAFLFPTWANANEYRWTFARVDVSELPALSVAGPGAGHNQLCGRSGCVQLAAGKATAQPVSIVPPAAQEGPKFGEIAAPPPSAPLSPSKKEPAKSATPNGAGGKLLNPSLLGPKK